MKANLPRIAITSGEPAGIGPDLCLMLAQQSFAAEITIIGDIDMLAARARDLNIDVTLAPFQATLSNAPTAAMAPQKPRLSVLHRPTAQAVQAGILNAKNSPYVLDTLHTAIKGCENNLFDALVTAPVHKGIINEAGINFSGHTEFLAEQTKTKQVVMLLAAINKVALEATIRILYEDLVNKFNIHQPRILVAGLNPHAGEGGYLGDEEITVINPVLEKLRTEGMQLIGALPADTLFTQHHLAHADAVLAMYHDQGLSVLKYASFGKGVNITLGLPIIRTSVDHGTALDLAGTGRIHSSSIQTAIDLAITLASNQLGKP